MKLLLVLLLLASTCFAQYKAAYDRSGRLTGLFNLRGPVDCGLMKFSGPIKEIRDVADESIIYFSMRAKRREYDVELDLGKLSNADRSNLFHSMMKKGRRVEVSGYACGSNGIVDPVHIKAVK